MNRSAAFKLARRLLKTAKEPVIVVYVERDGGYDYEWRAVCESVAQEWDEGGFVKEWHEVYE